MNSDEQWSWTSAPRGTVPQGEGRSCGHHAGPASVDYRRATIPRSCHGAGECDWGRGCHGWGLGCTRRIFTTIGLDFTVRSVFRELHTAQYISFGHGRDENHETRDAYSARAQRFHSCGTDDKIQKRNMFDYVMAIRTC